MNPDASRYRVPVTTFIGWEADRATGLEGVRLLHGPRGWRALGRMVRIGPGAAFSASYRLTVGADGCVVRLAITSATGDRERHLTLNRTEDGFWLLDTGTGGRRAEFDGAVDVDVSFSPLFNTLPVRRLGLHTGFGDHLVKVVFVALPELDVEVVEQHYRTVTPLTHGRAVVAFSADGFEADLELDEDGLVTSYPGIAHRVPALATSA